MKEERPWGWYEVIDQGDIQKHVANVEVYLTNPAGIGEHSNIVEAIEQELDMIAKYQDQIDIIQKYFKK